MAEPELYATPSSSFALKNLDLLTESSETPTYTPGSSYIAKSAPIYSLIGQDPTMIPMSYNGSGGSNNNNSKSDPISALAQALTIALGNKSISFGNNNASNEPVKFDLGFGSLGNVNSWAVGLGAFDLLKNTYFGYQQNKLAKATANANALNNWQNMENKVTAYNSFQNNVEQNRIAGAEASRRADLAAQYQQNNNRLVNNLPKSIV